MKDYEGLIYGLMLLTVIAITYILILSYRIEQFKHMAIKQDCAKYNSTNGLFEWKYKVKK